MKKMSVWRSILGLYICKVLAGVIKECEKEVCHQNKGWKGQDTGERKREKVQEKKEGNE